MDLTAAQSLSHAKIPGCSASIAPPIFHSKTSLLAHNLIPFHSSKVTLLPQQHGFRIKTRKHRSLGPIHASEGENTVRDVQDKWILEPVGDGDSRHIGYQVKMPDAFEIASNEVTVGRLPEKADMVIPVATVSGVHARLQKKGENLLVTDLDSTNGTFINEKRLSPGVVAAASSGSFITFGDIHLAMFRASKIESASKPEESEEREETGSSGSIDGNETS
ncbi:uncharacterized protein LOC8263127 [Ricinus communis]|uniref:FHA domain-containing protein n=1 Tax=Ricinus communis TaxID=3988 RepID=B9SL18_RICCO|nr:uncharacterized protein LOC8263127 [Ricinus communis]EEF35709.1 conserved hypothetical protein [Ricinus communis]|eukprot:XP_002526687.1 uncharacterized protein LOC8263127 [Ricinus communis]